MKDFQDRVFSYDPGSNCSDLLATQMAAALEEQGHKKKGGKKSKKKQKKLVKQLRQQLTETKHECRKLKKKIRRKKGGKKTKKKLRALEEEYELLKLFLNYQGQLPAVTPQQNAWWQDMLIDSAPKLLELLTALKSGKPLKNQQLPALPPPRDRK